MAKFNVPAALTQRKLAELTSWICEIYICPFQESNQTVQLIAMHLTS